MDTEAQEQFQQAVGADGGFHRARGQLVLYEYKRTQDLDRAVQQLELVIQDAKFQNVEALTALAALQMERGSEVDLEEAKKNLQRALAIDDSFMPAFNQLAVYYLEAAKSKAAKSAGRERRGRRALVVAAGRKAKVSGQQLDLAALVASQGLRKNPQYAPLHNTVGLIQVELENFNGAVKSFGKARALDTGFFEAHMNYGAVNLSFRGFQEAEKAYKAALKLHPDEFDAHLGLALAIRGQINPGNRKELLKRAEEHLQKARQLEPDRAEPYYNEAILTQEYKAKGEEEQTIPALRKAAELYQEFIGRAGNDDLFAEAVERAKDRTQDIEDTIKFIEEGKVARAEAERAAEEAAAQKAAEKAEKKAEKKPETKAEKGKTDKKK
jgi:tetratricopeptide (TPR) repeat protein